MLRILMKGSFFLRSILLLVNERWDCEFCTHSGNRKIVIKDTNIDSFDGACI